eukprot:TRINITY_DN11684_c0_g1_i2.p1 TRINITY_DN11684_c0_g1~~TRINITY_DN11684_c0_g1_i2.p1  ORF type:complete len:264 (-),score=75.90 TRINITY_DN11684_c0_g1_i2:114-905(-)
MRAGPEEPKQTAEKLPFEPPARSGPDVTAASAPAVVIATLNAPVAEASESAATAPATEVVIATLAAPVATPANENAKEDPNEEAEEEESEWETDSESEMRANPDLGLKRSSIDESSNDPWRLFFRWMATVIQKKLEEPPPIAVAKQLRQLLPIDGLNAEKLSVNDLCDGQLLCALLISVKPDAMPRVNPVALGRIAGFLKALPAIGVNQVSFFTPPDLMGDEPSNPAAVLRCLQALAATLQNSPGWSGPQLAGVAAAGKGKGR